MRPSRTNTARAAMLGIGMLLLLGAGSASAAVTVSTSGSTILIGSATGSNQTYIDVEDTNTDGTTFDSLTIQNVDGSSVGIFLDPDPHPDCVYAPDNPNIKVSCSLNYDDIHANYGAGNDEFRFLNVCVGASTINLGDGTNVYTGQGCPSSTINVTGGSGQDTFNGYSDAGATVEVLNGGGGDDNLYGGAGDDIIHGWNGPGHRQRLHRE